MIENETVAPRERRLVAAVIYNRLRNRMPLGVDATIRYGDIPGTEPLTKQSLRARTRTTPAAARPPADADREPGLASIRRPRTRRRRDYLYYVRKPSSKAHYFTSSESDFLRKVCEYGYACD